MKGSKRKKKSYYICPLNSQPYSKHPNCTSSICLFLPVDSKNLFFFGFTRQIKMPIHLLCNLCFQGYKPIYLFNLLCCPKRINCGIAADTCYSNHPTLRHDLVDICIVTVQLDVCCDLDVSQQEEIWQMLSCWQKM